jgi:hypothetical protein
MTLLNQFRSTIAKGRPVILAAMCFGLAACSSVTKEIAKIASARELVAEAAGTNLPAGWSVRADSGTGDDNKLTIDGGVYHFMMGGPPSNNGTFYNPAWTATGNHTLSATFTENTKATHPTSYGLVFGGSNVGGNDQMYSYFLVRQAGEFYVANRDGAAVKAVVPWTANKAIKPEADGKQTNTLSVQVTGPNVVFSVNGTEVDRQPAASLHVNGLYGFRVGHRLDVTVTNVMK